jgi:hypothetical protein
MALAGMLLANGFDPVKRLYVPLTETVRLRAKLTKNFGALPKHITADVGTTLSYFGNPLLVPEGYGHPGFDIDRALAPTLRATNAGFVIVTHEHDCQNQDQFDEVAAWNGPSGRFKDVDAELRNYKDYDGFSIVFSGNHSLHHRIPFC